MFLPTRAMIASATRSASSNATGAPPRVISSLSVHQSGQAALGRIQVKSASSELGLYPPPCGEGRRAAPGWGSCGDPLTDPHPQPLPTRGRGAHRVRGVILHEAQTKMI